MSNFQEIIIRNSSGDTANVLTNSNTNNGELLVNLQGHQCLDNSTTTPLGADEVYTGTSFQDTIDYGVLTVSVNADVDSAIDGLEVQWSVDGINVTDTDNFSILGGNGKTFTFGPAQRYYRIKYTNNSDAQSEFYIVSILRKTYVKPSSHRINDNIIGEDDAELVKSVLAGEDYNGIFQNVKTDLGGLLRVNSFPYTYGIAEGDVGGHDALLTFGTRTTVAANTYSTIWEGNTPLYQYLSTAEQLQIVSTDVNDTLLGTGARTIRIIGLDGDYNEIYEDVNLSGTTNVTTTKAFLRVFNIYVTEVGTVGISNLGTITVNNNADTITQAIINIGDGQSIMAIWTVPSGKTAYITNGSFSTSSNKGAIISFLIKEHNGVEFPWLIKYRAYTFSGNANFPFTIPFKITEKSDVEVRVLTPTSAGSTSNGATFELWYEDND